MIPQKRRVGECLKTGRAIRTGPVCVIYAVRRVESLLRLFNRWPVLRSPLMKRLQRRAEALAHASQRILDCGLMYFGAARHQTVPLEMPERLAKHLFRHACDAALKGKEVHRAHLERCQDAERPLFRDSLVHVLRSPCEPWKYAIAVPENPAEAVPPSR